MLPRRLPDFAGCHIIFRRVQLKVQLQCAPQSALDKGLAILAHTAAPFRVVEFIRALYGHYAALQCRHSSRAVFWLHQICCTFNECLHADGIAKLFDRASCFWQHAVPA